MRHKWHGRRLNRAEDHLLALSRNLVCSLFQKFGTEREYVFTTIAKAKEFRSLAERLITTAKKGRALLQAAESAASDQEKASLMAAALHKRRQIESRLANREMAKKVWDEIAPRYADRPGGYTRVLRTSSVRLGDGVYRAIWGFVGGPGEEPGAKVAKKKRARKRTGAGASAPASA